jgi:probable HAF family extracellular repeat protein
VLWHNGSPINLGTLGGNVNQALDINNHGQVIGNSDFAGDTATHTFLWQNGTMSDLGTLPGDIDSFAGGINDEGQIVGESCNASGICRGYLWQKGTMYDLNTLVPPSDDLDLPFGSNINDRGEITGATVNTSGVESAIVLLPGGSGSSYVVRRSVLAAKAPAPGTGISARGCGCHDSATVIKRMSLFRRAHLFCVGLAAATGPSVAASNNRVQSSHRVYGRSNVMNATGLIKYAAAVLAIAICSACSGGSTVAPSSSAPSVRYVGKTLWLNGRPVTAARANLVAPPRFEALAPDANNGKKREYVFNDYGSYAAIFDYPKSDEQIGEISGLGGQGCTNVLYGYGKRIFWNVGGYNAITEFKVRKSAPIKTLTVSSNDFPSSCGMDTSGDLAVGILDGPHEGDLEVFKKATGTPTIYTTPLVEEFFNGYDPQGDLFADGFNDSFNFQLVELPAGSTTFKAISTSNTVLFPGSVQWDGTYLTVFDQEADALYQYTVSGTTATLEGTVSLSSASDCAQTWIVKGLIYCGDAGRDEGSVFNYPAGGSALAVLGSGLPEPLGVTAARK